MTLIDRELVVSIFGDLTGNHPPVLAERAEVEAARRLEEVARREEEAAGVEERLQGWSERLLKWEGELETREQRVEFVAIGATVNHPPR